LAWSSSFNNKETMDSKCSFICNKIRLEMLSLSYQKALKQ
jgi:hypothetical protein